jgi:hypothetical protein
MPFRCSAQRRRNPPEAASWLLSQSIAVVVKLAAGTGVAGSPSAKRAIRARFLKGDEPNNLLADEPPTR